MKNTNLKFEKLCKALITLEAIYKKPVQDDRSNIDATIQRFEFTYELLWKSLKELLNERGFIISSPREAFNQAFQINLIEDEKIWLNMMKDRNLSSHTYDEALADEVFKRIKVYVPLIRKLVDDIKKLPAA